MAAWTQPELERLARADELDVAAREADGTLRAARPIWAVRVADGLYARAAYGSGSAWHRIARQTGRAEISGAGVRREVAVEDADAAVLDAVDQAYRDKYAGRYAGIVVSITSDDARASTVRLSPHEESR